MFASFIQKNPAIPRKAGQNTRRTRRLSRLEMLEARQMLSCDGFLTYSQGGYGNTGVPGAYLTEHFGDVFPNGVQIGSQTSGAATDNNATAGNWAALFTSATAVQAYLPNGGGAAPLGGDFTNPNGPGNDPGLTLGGQTLTMMLNLGFDAADPNWDGNTTNDWYGDLVYEADSGVTTAFNGLTVSQIVDLANQYLSGAASAYTGGQLTEALRLIVEEWHEGQNNTTNVLKLTCPDEPTFQNIEISGVKYNDHNANGVQDPGEEAWAGWVFILNDDGNGVVDDGEVTAVSDANGKFSFTDVGPGEWTVTEAFEGWEFVPTQGENGYSGTAVSGVNRADLAFGNVELAGTSGKTIGFWSNKNGQALITPADIVTLNNLNLKNADGSDACFKDAASVKAFLLKATATNMANMLSAQLAATVLNQAHQFFGSSTTIYVNGVLTTWSGNTQGLNLAANLDNDGDSDNADADGLVNEYGFASIQSLIDAANTELALHSTAMSGTAWRTYQEALKIAFDGMNNNLAIFAL